ncbi:phage tail fiber protein [Xenorhabdus stockiae]|uniref:phage tail fiber protein n=1 Tax=Xenorhabdus stockiae TaxID=351614 RepID=UPI004063CF75
MQDKKPDVPVSDESNLVIVTTPEYVKEAIAEHAASRNHPYATQAEPGFVTLSNAIDNDSEITAATSKAVKKAYDLANTANQNALNNNSNLYLEKKQNGADIPDKSEFVRNIGLENVVYTAPPNGAYQKIDGTLKIGSWMEVKGELSSEYEDNKLNLKTYGPNGGYPHIVYKWAGGGWYHLSLPPGNGELLSVGANCSVGPNGYIMKSAPTILIYTSGKFATDDESEGTTVEYLSKGTYLIKGVKGFSGDEAVNSIDIPLCQNKLPLIWVDNEVLPDGSIKLMTYHREHSDAPAFARNIREGYADGDLIDIPEGRFVSVRVQMPDTK